MVLHSNSSANNVRTCPRDLIIPRLDHPDLKSENVLICIVEPIIQSELAITASNPASLPTKLVVVPPLKGQVGNQTPLSQYMALNRSHLHLRLGPMLDKLVFGMSKTDREGCKPGSVGSARAIWRETRSEMKEMAGEVSGGNQTHEGAERLSNMSRFETTPRTTRPSLLTQIAPSHARTTVSSSNTGPSLTSIAPSALIPPTKLLGMHFLWLMALSGQRIWWPPLSICNDTELVYCDTLSSEQREY